MNSSDSPRPIFEDNHLLVLSKPSGWIVQGATAEDASLLSWGKQYLKQRYNKPGNVYLGCVSRLDRLVTGIVPFARTSKSAARLNEQIRNREVHKEYLAIVSPPPPTPEGKLEHHCMRNDARRITVAHDRPQNGSQHAVLSYRTLQTHHKLSLLSIRLETGRKHQIRAQLQALGSPIVGDARYDSTRSFGGGIALHCWQFTLIHPTSKEVLTFRDNPPREWLEFGIKLPESNSITNG